MRFIIYILISFVIFSCGTTKNVIENKDIKNDSIVKVENIKIDTMSIDSDSDGVIDNDDECPNVPGSVSNNGCPEVLALEKVDNTDRKPSSEGGVEIITEPVEKKPVLKVIDKTTKNDNPNFGLVAHSVPKEMQVGKTYTVKLRISKEKNKVQLINGNGVDISDNIDSKITIASIRVEPVMSAKLISDSSKMLVQSTSTSVQDIEKEGFTEWEWRLTPIKGGDIFLKLMVSVIVEDSLNNKITKDIPVYDEIINVKSNVGFTIKGFINQYWQWLMTTIIIPFIIWFYNRKKKKEK